MSIFVSKFKQDYQKSITASLEKKTGAHRSFLAVFFLFYKDTDQKLRFTQECFTPDTKIYSSLRNVLSCYGSNWYQTKS